MADLINVTPEKLKATASSFQQAGKDVKKTTSDMLQLVRGISSSIWSGEASSIYLVSLMDWMPIRQDVQDDRRRITAFDNNCTGIPVSRRTE